MRSCRNRVATVAERLWVSQRGGIDGLLKVESNLCRCGWFSWGMMSLVEEPDSDDGHEIESNLPCCQDVREAARKLMRWWDDQRLILLRL